MPDKVMLPSKPQVVSEEGHVGVYEIEGLYPGYGYTMGNALRRVILSSLPGAAITSLKITGVNHEFSTLEGVKEDVIAIILNLKKIPLRLLTDEPVHASIKKKGEGAVTSGDINLPGQLEIVDKKVHIATITDKNTEFEVEMTIEKGIGYAAKETIHREKADIGVIPLDANFTSVRRTHYEVENMRVSNRTDFNRLRIIVETNGAQTPREALEDSIRIIINQLKAIVGFQEEELISEDYAAGSEPGDGADSGTDSSGSGEDVSKMKIEDLDLSARTMNALLGAGVKSVAGLTRRTADDILALDGVGGKGLDEIKTLLASLGAGLKE